MAEWLQITLGILGFLTATASAIAAFLAWGITKKQLQPELVVYLECIGVDKNVYLVVENIGAGPAYGIKFSSASPLQTTTNRANGTRETIATGAIVNGIPILTAGRKQHIYWDRIVSVNSDLITTNCGLSLTYYKSFKDSQKGKREKTAGSPLSVSMLPPLDDSLSVAVSALSGCKRAIENVNETLSKDI